ncbi:MAG: hypothetical protein LBD99_05385, partial [Candidatus Margulisbacteria bacterium]|nr:hypothetical protein [Candidatus Margulisiibacteriota bacterium]
IGGANVNGFSLRAGPPRGKVTTSSVTHAAEGVWEWYETVTKTLPNSQVNKPSNMQNSGTINNIKYQPAVRNGAVSTGNWTWRRSGNYSQNNVAVPLPAQIPNEVTADKINFSQTGNANNNITYLTGTWTYYLSEYKSREGPQTPRPSGVPTTATWRKIKDAYTEIIYNDSAQGGGLFVSTNGTELFADGPLQIRFAKNGNVSIQLGFVPETAMGVNLHVRRFDTDVGGANNKISYYYKKSYDNGRTVGAEVHNSAWENMPMGTLDKTNNTVGNGEWHEDILPIPEDYEGGVWYCTYYAASNDCSYWEMWYEGYNEGANGFAALVD